MVKGDDGVWTNTSAPQSPGYHNYRMLVDGAVVQDPGTNAFIGYSHMCNPVLYLQHGGGEDEQVWIEMDRTHVILDNPLEDRL